MSVKPADCMSAVPVSAQVLQAADYRLPVLPAARLAVPPAPADMH